MCQFGMFDRSGISMHLDHTCCSKANGATGACRRSYLFILAPILCLLYTCKHSFWEPGFEAREGTAVLWCPKSRMHINKMASWIRIWRLVWFGDPLIHTPHQWFEHVFHVIFTEHSAGVFFICSQIVSDPQMALSRPGLANANQTVETGAPKSILGHRSHKMIQNVPCHIIDCKHKNWQSHLWLEFENDAGDCAQIRQGTYAPS